MNEDIPDDCVDLENPEVWRFPGEDLRVNKSVRRILLSTSWEEVECSPNLVNMFDEANLEEDSNLVVEEGIDHPGAGEGAGEGAWEGGGEGDGEGVGEGSFGNEDNIQGVDYGSPMLRGGGGGGLWHPHLMGEIVRK